MSADCTEAPALGLGVPASAKNLSDFFAIHPSAFASAANTQYTASNGVNSTAVR